MAVWGSFGQRGAALGRARIRHDDAGVTLLEILIAIVILAIASGALIQSVRMGIEASDLNKKHSKVMASLRSYGEALANVGDASLANGYAYTPCATPSNFPSAATLQISSPNGITLSVRTVETWNGVTYSDIASGCVAANDLGLQRLTLDAQSEGSGITVVEGSLQVYIRKPCTNTAAC